MYHLYLLDAIDFLDIICFSFSIRFDLNFILVIAYKQILHCVHAHIPTISYIFIFRSHFGSSTCSLAQAILAQALAFSMDSDDDVALGSASSQEPPDDLSDNDDVLLPGSQAGVGSGDPVREPRPLPMAGLFACWIVCPRDDFRHVAGVAKVQWDVTPYADDVAEAHASLSAELGNRDRVPQCVPFLQYTLRHVFLLDEPVLLPSDFSARSGPLGAHDVGALCDGRFEDGAFGLADIERILALSVNTLFFLPPMASATLGSGVCEVLVHSIELGPRLPPGGIPGGFPPRALLHRIRQRLGPTRTVRTIGPETYADWQQRYDDELLKLPQGLRAIGARRDGGGTRLDADSGSKGIDPVLMLRGLGVTQYLRSSKFFTKVMAAAKKYDHPTSAPRDGADDPARTSFERHAAKLDIVDCLLERRAFHADRIFDCVDCIQVYTDASPVTGEELQGMLMDIHYNDGRPGRRATLPGATLFYGQFGAIAKTIAVLWAAFLICGPSFEDMAWWLSKVTAVLTDGGTERHTIEVPDVLRAFLRWVGGADLMGCADLVNHYAFLLPNALRVLGWCHAWSNIMKTLANVCPRWKHVLDQMRELVKFWRDRTWRRWVQTALVGTPVDPRLFRSFTATIAKWRYGTIPNAQQQLLALREVHERYLQPEMFTNAQDKAQIKAVFEAAKDKDLWVFMQASYTHIFDRCELARHWGMTCTCAEHVRQRQVDGVKHIECFQNSRKLKEAWPFLSDLKQETFEKGCNFTVDQCEGNKDVWMCILTMLHKQIVQVDQRFGYLSRLPHIIVRCDSVEGAKEFMLQLRAKPWREHEPLTRILAERVGGDIEKRSQGEDVTPALRRVIDTYCKTPFDESCGEGYHRGTHLEHSRAPHSTSAHLKQVNRFKTVLKKTEAFAEAHGERGAAVVRFEWRAWKRILQVDPRRRWYPMKIPAADAGARVYREDKRAQDNWEVICRRQAVSCPVIPEKVDGKEALRNEFLVSTLETNSFYSVSTPDPRMAAEGGAPVAQVASHFQLLEKSYGNRRPDYMSVADPGAAVALQAGLAFLVSFLQHRAPEGAGAGGVVPGAHHVYVDSPPMWVRPHDICPSESWYKRLYKWAAEPSDLPASILIRDSRLVYNRIPYADEHCPTICVAWKLNRLGWAAVQRACLHDRSDVASYDAYPAVKMKYYFQVLLSLGVCLDLTSSIPSRQPVLYYKLLLAGQRVEPGLGHDAYKLIWKRLEQAGLVPAIELPPPSPDNIADPIQDENDDVALPAPGPPEAPAPKRRRTDAPRGPGRPGRGGDGTPGTPVPPPPIELPPDEVPLAPPSPEPPAPDAWNAT